MPGTKRVTRAEARSEVKRKAGNERKKREAKLFQLEKVIGPNDLAVNPILGKVKLEEPEDEVKPILGNKLLANQLEVEEEVKVITVPEESEVEMDIDETLPPDDSDRKGSLSGFNENKMLEDDYLLEKTVADQHQEIESLRKQLKEALAISSPKVKASENGVSNLAAENKVLREEIKSLKEVIVDQSLEIQRLRKKCKEEPVAVSSQEDEESAEDLPRSRNDVLEVTEKTVDNQEGAESMVQPCQNPSTSSNKTSTDTTNIIIQQKPLRSSKTFAVQLVGKRKDFEETLKKADDPLICVLCKKKFTSNKYLIVHQRLHFGETGSFKCGICQKEYRSKGNLKEHQNAAHAGVRYKCKTCRKEYASAGKRKEHERKAHPVPVIKE